MSGGLGREASGMTERRHRHPLDGRDELTEAAEHAGTDVAQPVPGHDRAALDAETDLGVDGEPPEFRG